MNLENIAKAAAFKTRRDELLALRRVAYTGTLTCTLNGFGSDRHDVIAALTDEPLRAAIGEICSDQLRVVEKCLLDIGVRVSDPEPPENGTADEWRRRAASLQHAWIRELGRHLRNKRDLIDALVVSTADVVEKADAYDRDMAATKAAAKC